MSLIELRNTDWEQTIKVSDKPIIVEFWHQSCPLCKKIEQTFLGLASKMVERAYFARLNVMESKDNRRLAIQLGVMGTPTIKVFCNSIEMGEIVGLETLNNLEKTLETILLNCS